VRQDRDGTAAIHETTGYNVCARWSDDGARDHAFIARVAPLADQPHLDRRVLPGEGPTTVAQQGGDGRGSAGQQPQTGAKGIAILAHHGDVWAPLPVAPVQDAATGLRPEGVTPLTRVGKRPGLGLTGAARHLAGGVDSQSHRKAICKAGMLPHLTEHPRQRNSPKRGRQRWCKAAMQALRERVERTFAWEDQCKRWLRRFEHSQPRHSGMNLRAYTLLTLRHCCRA
jgi:hypothetical protein